MEDRRRGEMRSDILTWLALLACVGCAPAGVATQAPVDCPPASERPALTRVADLGAGIWEDVRYATADNFTGARLPGYGPGAALLRPEAAAALARVQHRLEARGLGLLVWDAYRPVRATEAMVAWAQRTGNEWVLDRGYVARRSNHNRGNTVDLTLVRLDGGEPLDMGTPYDHFGPESHTANAHGDVLANRRVLLDAMAAERWTNYDQEWWHFTYAVEAGFLDVPIPCY